ncbi:DUF4331 domain-containing protein [Pseudoduganella sp. FT25W]|uniref:DUF4331 domain-containing protein n=1 Tax=Duganella alba TaxID=2666081 RepID=A0A6L5QQ24_9BURK|nr:DUF4331 domain-containing protein [Duganella alba]MRX11779.1 DUF4331 domain-containing protein [Duganella alba]MRX20235.1 DUF4331 domain-containing protein [Duganella alba]
MKKICSMLALAGLSAMTLAQASSHREAPNIAQQPSVDSTDLYVFRSYEPGRAGYVTILADYIPFQTNVGGAHFYQFNPNALYEIHIDNTGSGAEALTFQFRFTSTSNGIAVPVGGKQTKIPLIHAAPSPTPGAPPTLNVTESYTLNLVRGDRRTGQSAAVTNAAGGANPAVFTKPVDYLGDKTFGSSAGYSAYANKYIYDVNIPGCAAPGRVFVGQRKEPFYLLDGKLFDLLNFNLTGPEVGGNNNDLESNNITTLALELPIACVTAGTDPVIGVWTTASLRQGRLLNNVAASGLNKYSKEGGAWTQVSRLGNPLFNEVIIGMDDKDKYSGAKPKNDQANFGDYVSNPAFPALIQAVFPQFKAPTNFPRTDLSTVFLKGIKGVNQPATPGALAEMMRLNTAVPPTALNAQNPLGVGGGDNAGYPNGRRPGDDVVDISIRAAMGVLCVLTGANDSLQLGCHPGDAPSGTVAFTDGVRKTAANFGTAFPYLTPPVTGSLNPPAPSGTVYP